MQRLFNRFVAVVLVALAVASARADQVQVFAPSVVRASIAPIIAKFEAGTGHSVQMNYGGTGLLLKKLVDGEKADVVVLPLDKVQAMAIKGEVEPASVKPKGAVGIGVAIKPGAPKSSTYRRSCRSLISAWISARSAFWCAPAIRSRPGSLTPLHTYATPPRTGVCW